MHHRGGAVLHRVAASGVALVRRQRGVGGNEFDRLHVDAELLGRDLEDGGLDALAELRFAGEDADLAVGADLQPRVELRGAIERAGELLCRGRHGARDNERTALLEKLLPVHDLLFISSPARAAAWTMSMCVPQRQWSVSSALWVP